MTLVSVRKFYAWKPKIDATLVDVREGRLSFHTGRPLNVSRLETPRGAYFVVDGHHRLVEALLSGKRALSIAVDPHLPWIERTGGAHRDVLQEKVNAYDYLRGLVAKRRHRMKGKHSCRGCS